MKIIYEYSHLGGSEILMVRYPKYEKEIYEVVANVKANKIKISEEKTMKGKELYSPKDMNYPFAREFKGKNFSELRDTYSITLPNCSTSINGAFKQIDFVKEKVLVEVQFGKYAAKRYPSQNFGVRR